MTLRKTSPEGVVEVTEDGAVHRAKLYDFDVDGADLKTRHKEYLHARATRLLVADPTKFARITGKASKTGNEDHNFDLSNHRAEQAMAFLANEGIATDRLRRHGVGSSESLVAGEDARSRAVDVEIWKIAPSPSPTPTSGPTHDAPPVVTLQGEPVFKVLDRSNPQPAFGQSQIPFEINNPKATRKLKIVVRSELQREPLRTVVFTSGEMLQPGKHTWNWDGYDEHGRLRSVFLTNWLFIQVHADHGSGYLMFSGEEAPDAPNFASVDVDTAKHTVAVLVAVRVGPSSFPGKAPPPGSVDKAQRLIVDGIHKYWSRNSGPWFPGAVSAAPRRKLNLSSGIYDVDTMAMVTDYGVEYVVEKVWLVERSCNWGVLEEGLPIAYVVTKEDDWNEIVGAHEFGHSVLADGWGREYSLKHKGTTNAIQNAIGPPAPLPPTEIDLMKYYKRPLPDDYVDRVVATEEDVVALIATVRLKFSSRSK